MEWYDGLPPRLASKPPAYVVERTSDLRHAFDVSKISPSTARTLLDRLISQLGEHHDNEYVTAIQDASRVVLDNPNKARQIIGFVVQTMEADKEAHDADKLVTWKWKKRIN